MCQARSDSVVSGWEESLITGKCVMIVRSDSAGKAHVVTTLKIVLLTGNESGIIHFCGMIRPVCSSSGGGTNGKHPHHRCILPA